MHNRCLYLDVSRIKQSDAIIALGSLIKADSSEQDTVNHRVSAGWACYRRWASVLESPASISSRATLWTKTVLMSLTWGLQSLRGDNYVAEKLDFVQAQMFRKMVKFKRRKKIRTVASWRAVLTGTKEV